MYQRNILIHRFPTKEPYNHLKKSILDTTEKIKFLLCKVKKNYYKKSTLEEIDANLELLREYIRECCDDPKISINFESARFWIDTVDEVGAMVGSWLKKESSKDKYNKDNTIPGFAPIITKEDISDKLYRKEEPLKESDIYTTTV